MSYEFFPGLSIIIICRIFNDLGQYSSRIMALNVYIRFISSSFGSSFSILAVIRSKPGAFLWFNILLPSNPQVGNTSSTQGILGAVVTGILF